MREVAKVVRAAVAKGAAWAEAAAAERWEGRAALRVAAVRVEAVEVAVKVAAAGATVGVAATAAAVAEELCSASGHNLHNPYPRQTMREIETTADGSVPSLRGDSIPAVRHQLANRKLRIFAAVLTHAV